MAKAQKPATQQPPKPKDGFSKLPGEIRKGGNSLPTYQNPPPPPPVKKSS